MKLSRIVLAAASAAALFQAQAAQAAQSCITEAEITGMMAFALPSALQGVTSTCRHTCPRTASSPLAATR
jgi:hypothetical protein